MESSVPSTLHSAKLTQSLLNQLKRDVFHHPVNSLDLAQWDYHLIPGLKCDLGGRHFTMKENLQSTVKRDAERYNAGIHKLILRYNKYFDEQGDYIENFVKNLIHVVSMLHLFFFYQFCEQCNLICKMSLVYETVWCVHTLLIDDCCFTITNMR